jgi:hypothetical protein
LGRNDAELRRIHMTIRVPINRRSIATAFILLGVAATFIWWLNLPPSKTKQLLPLMVDLDAFKSTNGLYPTSCVAFASYSNLASQFRVYPGERDTNGIFWETRKVSDHTFTVMVDREGYEIFFPVGRMKMISFTSFPVWRYSSAEQRWRKGRIHWSYADNFTGSYWSKD